MEEKTKDFKEQLLNKLNSLFLHTTFTEISFLKGEVAKHLDINESNISLIKEKNGEDNMDYSLKIFDYEYNLSFKHRVKEPREIEVPKVVKNPHKWWQFGEPDTKVIVEKKNTKEVQYWLLSSISQ